MENIRNFCIIAHIDHGKSTLADRFLESTRTVEKRKMKEQLLDQMDLERERGITIKLQPVRMNYGLDGREYLLNLIDTPGHVDFNYEVSRSLAAVEGAVLLVDATKGVQAQTLSNLYLAIEQGLEIIPVINKIDLPNSNVAKVMDEITHIIGCPESEVLLASGKTGLGVPEILERIIRQVPAPAGDPTKPLRALIFDSKYDTYKGVLAYVRVIDGEAARDQKITMQAAQSETGVVETGYFRPDLQASANLKAGEIGYIATGLRDVKLCRVGDTIGQSGARIQALPGYKEVKPMVYASLYPTEGDDYNIMRDALEKLKLNDAAFVFEPESNPALGKGFRCGFLGLLHLEIVRARLEREFDFSPVVTTPSVVYEVKTAGEGERIKIYAASQMPDPATIQEIHEPFVKLEIVTPSEYLGSIMELMSSLRSTYLNTEYINPERIILLFEIPLTDILVNFHDDLKSVSSGYASMNYEVTGYRPSDLVKLDIMVAGDRVEALSRIVPKERAHSEGSAMAAKLKDVIPRQNFVVPIQAAIGGKIIARETIRPFRKDVTAKLYGGDVTRKRKLLEKQKKGKKKMMHSGRVQIPSEAYLAVLKK